VILQAKALVEALFFYTSFPILPFFFTPRRKKQTFIFAFRQPFRVLDGVKEGVIFGAVQRPLMVILRGANLPYFGKRGNNVAYSPQEPQKRDMQGFPVLARGINREKEPLTGLFFFRVMTPFIPVS